MQAALQFPRITAISLPSGVIIVTWFPHDARGTVLTNVEAVDLDVNM